MALAWLAPTLIAGVVLALVTHSWVFLVLSMVTALTGWMTQSLRGGSKLEGPVRISGAGVAIGNRVLPRSTAFWRAEWKATVFEAVQVQLAQQSGEVALNELVQNDFQLSDAEPIEGLVGFTNQGQLRFSLALDGPHLFIVGPTGSGKSRWLELYLSSLINSHQELDFWYADFKGGATLGRFANHSSCAAFTTDLEPSEEFWAKLNEFLHQRETQFAELKVARIEQGSFRRQIVVVDELVPALRSSHQAAAVIEAIATRGRSLGIHLISSSQGTSGVGRVLLTNLRAKLVLAGTDAVDLAQLGITQRLNGEVAKGQASGLLVTASQTSWFSFPLLFRPANLPMASRRGRGRRQLEH